MTKPREEFRIVFMGTPVFAVRMLESLHSAGYPVVAVVTAPDKPAGRGQKLKPSAVKLYAIQHGLPLLQPVSLKDEKIITGLASLKPNLSVVVAFRMLPESVWKLPTHGTVNLHASLLPQYRGAAPINWAIINGEVKTGVTTFFIDRNIDTGNLLLQEEIPVGQHETAGELHDRLMESGARLILKTADAIRQNNIEPIHQHLLIKEGEILNKAPKIFKEDCRIDWKHNASQIFNLIRGLSPSPSAFTLLHSPDGTQHHFKILNASTSHKSGTFEPGSILIENQKRMHIATSHGFIELFEIQMEGKARMSVSDFLNGFRNASDWKAI